MKTFFKCLGIAVFGLTVSFAVDALNRSALAFEYYTKTPATVALIENNALPKKQPAEEKDNLVILNFGDAMFSRGVRKAMTEKSIDPFEFVKTSDNWLKADEIVLNLEGPISDAEHCQEKAYSFRFDPEVADMLANNKIGSVTLSNNHSHDCFDRGLADTRTFLWLAKVNHFGGGEKPEESYIEKEISGKKIAFVGINLTFDPTLNQKYINIIKELKSRNDYVFAHIHWGEEYSTKATSEQKVTGRAIIDAGADAIIGHHPHVVEPVEIYKNKPIFYSLGNFIFDQLEPLTKEGIGIKIEINNNGEQIFTILPYKIDSAQPKFLDEIPERWYCNEFLKNIPWERINICGIKKAN